MFHDMLNHESLPEEQVTPGAPWRIRLTAAVRRLFVDWAAAGYVAKHVARARLTVQRATVTDWIQRDKLKSVVLQRKRGIGWRVRIPNPQLRLFGDTQ